MIAAAAATAFMQISCEVSYTKIKAWPVLHALQCMDYKYELLTSSFSHTKQPCVLFYPSASYTIVAALIEEV